MNYEVNVELGDRSYPIHIGTGILDTAGGGCKTAGLKGKCLVVTDANVAPLYAERVVQSLTAAGFNPLMVVLPAGETTKSQEHLFSLFDQAARHGLDRKCFMVALGGGVVGDLTGFAAASWLRGIRFVQIPTTLLSMVDSSVGGKTGINIPAGKNLVGAFHQPELVLMDLDTLNTLPPREFAAGMAEVVKTGVIWDAGLFQRLEEVDATPSARFQSSEELGKIIARCCEIKAEVVRQDEREGGLRGILNFGHTLGHAVENAAGYGEILHGEAVAIGMVYAARLSVALKGLSAEEAARIEKLLAGLLLPVGAPNLEWDELRAAMALDKKTIGGHTKFVLIDRIGRAEFGCEVPEELLQEVWDGMKPEQNH